MHWRLKGAIQSILGAVPRGAELHYFLQRRAGGLKDFTAELRTKIDDGLLMLGNLRDVRTPIAGSSFLEIGSGWYPTLPLLLHFGGAKSIHTVDLNRHMRLDLAARCASGIAARATELAAVSGRGAEEIESAARATVRALDRGAGISEATDGVIQYHAPADASATSLPAESLDVVFSNDVLEHIPGPIIERIFAEAKRLLKPGGIMFHAVNCGDHYAYSDRSISQLNYLRYSDSRWAKYDNAFLYQNRLRAIDFTTMARAAGFAIELDTSRPHPKRLAELAAIDVDPQFSRYTRDQLAITSITFVGRKPGSASS
ncbi:MAG: methyltransferase domain-containing protein [Polyangiales bacterium]